MIDIIGRICYWYFMVGIRDVIGYRMMYGTVFITRIVWFKMLVVSRVRSVGLEVGKGVGWLVLWEWKEGVIGILWVVGFGNYVGEFDVIFMVVGSC